MPSKEERTGKQFDKKKLNRFFEPLDVASPPPMDKY
jgi:hypothetical protein